MPTCNKRVIELSVVANCFAEMVIGTVTVGDALCRPHKPVRLHLKAGARTVMVRFLKNLGKLGPVLPHGPLQQFSYNDEEEEELSNNARYALFM